jgi:hypothetical protein
MLFSNEIDESTVEQTKIARRVFVENEKKMLLDQVDDLTTTIKINKELMSEMFLAPD